MYSWTCELCGFVADSPDARTDHTATAIHTDEQRTEFSKTLDIKINAAIGPHVPTDINAMEVHKRASMLLLSTNTSRTTALAMLEAGCVRGAFVGLDKQQTLDLVSRLSTSTA
jgi:hypothetical protein